MSVKTIIDYPAHQQAQLRAEDRQERYEELAARLEFGAGMSRNDAQREARRMLAVFRREYNDEHE